MVIVLLYNLFQIQFKKIIYIKQGMMSIIYIYYMYNINQIWILYVLRHKKTFSSRIDSNGKSLKSKYIFYFKQKILQNFQIGQKLKYIYTT